MIFPGGIHVSTAARLLIDAADKARTEMRGTFNGFELVAQPGDTAEAVTKPFWDVSARRERQRERIATAERAVIDAAVGWRKSSPASYLAAHATLQAAVDALNAVRGKA